MKRYLRHFILAILTSFPIASIANAAAIAKGRERNGELRSANANDEKEQENKGSETDGNTSRD